VKKNKPLALWRLYSHFISHSVYTTAFLVFIFSFVTLALKARVQYISPYDEMYHLSYLQYLSDGKVPRIGDALNTWSMNYFSCNSVFPFGQVTDVACGEFGSASDYPEGGINSAQGWPPGFYLYAAIIVNALSVLDLDPLFLTRGISVFSWSLGCALIFMMQVRAGVDRLLAASISLVIASLPLAMMHGAFVTPHASTPVVVAFLSWNVFSYLGSKYDAQIPSLPRLFAVPFLALLVLPQAFPIVVFTTIFFVVAIAQKNYQNTSKIVVTKDQLKYVAALAFASSSLFIWERIQKFRTIDFAAGTDPSSGQVENDPKLDLPQLLSAIHRFLPRAFDQYQFQSASGQFLSVSWGYLAMGVIIYLIIQSSMVKYRIFGTSLLMAGVLYGVLAELLIPVEVSNRYGLSLAVLAIVATGLISTDRFSKLSLVSVSLLTYVACLPLDPFNH
jgi:hypothetical protein